MTGSWRGESGMTSESVALVLIALAAFILDVKNQLRPAVGRCELREVTSPLLGEEPWCRGFPIGV